MRLINTNTGAFEEFIGRYIPKYAILSHTWEEEEVSYQDYLGCACLHKKGYEKIRKTLELAREDGVLYAWVDTCCIDKSSSAELTEAINSMYQWYERSARCFVYLSDLEGDVQTQLSNCRWFSRGWTLQELIAPGSWVTRFFDKNWKFVGSKQSLCSQLSLITGIDAGILSHIKLLSSVCVAHKMSWAANRETTRIEDMAYCLLGLFDVNMPLLYGEESKAFRRLQEEIIRTTSDLSIFAWRDKPPLTEQQQPVSADLSYHCGILARTPSPFGFATSLLAERSRGFSREFSVCNQGVKTQSVVFRINGPSGNYILPLFLSGAGHYIGIRLRKTGKNTYVRQNPFYLHEYIDAPECDVYTSGDSYILVDKSSSDPLPRVRPHFIPSKGLWTDLFLSPHGRDFLLIEFATGVETYVEVLDRWGCFDMEDQVFFNPEGYQTNCAGMRFSVHLPKNDLGFDPSVTFECVLYAIGWSTPGETIQYTVIGSEQRKKDISIIEREFTQGSNTPSRLRPMFNRLNVPKDSSISFPIVGSRHSVLICLELLHLQQTIRVSCRIEKNKRITIPELSYKVHW